MIKNKFIYEKIYLDLKERILNGEYRENQKLPSIRNLSRSMGVSKNSVVYAFNLLEIEGLITAVERSGYFVNKIDPLNKTLVRENKDIVKKSKTKVKYDFSFNGVGKEYFDYKNLRKSFKNSIKDDDDSLLSQDNPLGNINLRKSIKTYLKYARNIEVDPEQIIISSGTFELLTIIEHLFPEKIFGFENPSYLYKTNSIFTNIKNIPMYLNETGLDVSKIDPDIDMALVSPTRQFPLTKFMDYHTRVDLLNWAYEKEDRYIIEDDYDAEFKYKLDKIYPLKSMDVNDKTIYLGNFSRTITPAIRISYMVLPNKILNENHRILEGLRCPVSNIVQEAVSYFIDEGYFEKQVNRMRVRYSTKYDYIYNRLKDAKGIKIKSSNPGISFVIEIEHIKSENLLESLSDKGVKIRSIKEYTYNNKEYDDWYLLGFAKLSMDEIVDGLDILINTVDELKKCLK